MHNALILHRRGSPRGDFLGNALLRSSSAQGGESSKQEPAVAREEVPKHGTPCAQQTPWWWLGLSLQRQTASSTKRWKEDRISSGWDCSFWAFTLSLRERHPQSICLRGRAMEDPPSSTKSKAKLTSIPSRLASAHATCRAAFSVCMRPRWAHAPFSLHQGTGARGSG